MSKELRLTMATWMTLLLLAGTAGTGTAAKTFPQPEVIAPNVTFWTKVYAEYPSSKGIVHDNRNLDIIYDVIDLVPYEQTDGAKTNRKRMKRACRKYADILRQLAQNPYSKVVEHQQVAALFEGRQGANTFRNAADRVRCQIGQKDRFRAGLIRSGAYLEEIRSIIKSYGLPEDLAYLPHVESSFNPNAYSKFGAAGIWQFTRSTGRRFMTVGYSLDERRDPILATHAAAALLKENYEKLGCWAMAITAYNHGANGMERAKRDHGDYTRIFQSYSSRTFKFASRNFYSEFLAARQVAADYKSYFKDLTLDRPVPTQTVVLDGYASLGDLSHHMKIDHETLRRLNPALRKPVLEGQKYVPKGYPLCLPLTRADSGDTLTAAIPQTLFHSKQKPSRFYTVQHGDTAYKIARQHGVRLTDLILANNLNRRATIYPHQNLRIPQFGEQLQASSERVEPPKPTLVASVVSPAQPAPTETSSQHATPETSAPETAPVSTPTNDGPLPEQKTLLAAKSAETGKELSEVEVAKEAPQKKTALTVAKADQADFGPPAGDPASTSPDAENDEAPALMQSTALNPHRPQVEPVEKPVLASMIPIPVKSKAAAESDTESIAYQARNDQIVTADVGFERELKLNGRLVGIIRVEVEETLGHYAEWAGVRTQQIRNLNGLRFGGVLRLHQKIKIPLHRVDARTFEQNRYEYHKRLQEDFFAAYRIGELQPYRVQPGDNYWYLCQQKFEIPMWLLKHCNPAADLADLRIKQKLIIPTIEKASSDIAESGILGKPEIRKAS